MRSIENQFRKVVTNAVSLLASDVTNRVATFALYAMVGRYLGPYEFGQLSLGITLFQTFQLFAIGGLKTYLTREVSKEKCLTSKYFINGSLVVLMFSLVSVIALIVLTKLLNYTADTEFIVYLMALALLPYALSVICDALFQAWEKMHYITYANVVTNIIKISLGFVILSLNQPLKQVVYLIVFCHVGTLILKLIFLSKYIKIGWQKIEFVFCKTIFKATLTFLGIDGLMAVMFSFNILLLSKLAGEIEVGLFTAANQLMIPISIVFESIMLSVFPIMCRNFKSSSMELKQVSKHLIEILLLLVIPTCMGLFFLANPLLLLLYGNEGFSTSTNVLRILVWVMILRVFTQVLGRVLLASLKERITLRILVVNLISTFLLAPILISQFGVIGAAFTALLVRVIDFVQHYQAVSNVFSKLELGLLAWKPIVASFGMSLYLGITKSQNLFISIISASLVYAIFLGGLFLWSLGGMDKLKTKYQFMWSK